MSPAETYAQSRRAAEDLIRQYALARLQDAAIERLLPAIALTATRTDDAEIAIGASKFGGAPDVATGFEWPLWNELPLSFVAQINLDEIAAFDIENKLPDSGLLSFFYDLNEDGDWPFGEIGDEGGWRVFHFAESLTRIDVPDEAKDENGIKTATISCRTVWSIPGYPYWAQWEELEKRTPEEKQKWWDLVRKFDLNTRHLMLGNPLQIQPTEPRQEAAAVLARGQSEDWQLLLQMDSDDEINWTWGDAGAMFYLMHRDDLATREWSKCWLIAQCH